MRAAVAVLLLLTGCSTFSNQGFREKNVTVEFSLPDENGDQYVISRTVEKIRLKDFVAAAPWKGGAGTEHAIEYEQTEDGWAISFGGANRLEGGDLAGLVSELSEALVRLSTGIPVVIPE